MRSEDRKDAAGRVLGLSPAREDRQRRRLPGAADLVFYIAILAVAVILGMIFWNLFGLPQGGWAV